MILIADSGSTKTEWRTILPGGAIGQAKTAGCNPNHQTVADIKATLENELLAQLSSGKPEEVFFYGAGCSSEKSKNIVRDAFAAVFPGASLVVESDLLAAARSLCLNEPGIACILGTGSNSCLFDGEKIIGNTPALGYVLGDEGSGSYLGKKVVADYLRRDMPEHLAARFGKRFPISADEVCDRIYRQPLAKPYLASFSRFLFHNLQDPYCYRLVYDSFTNFLQRNVVKYPDYQSLPVHFVGSIAFYYGNILRQAATDQGMRVGRILEGPIAGLALYHLGPDKA